MPLPDGRNPIIQINFDARSRRVAQSRTDLCGYDGILAGHAIFLSLLRSNAASRGKEPRYLLQYPLMLEKGKKAKLAAV